MKLVLVAIAGLVAANFAFAMSAQKAADALYDPNRLLSDRAGDKIVAAAKVFEILANRRMVVIVLPRGKVPDVASLKPFAGEPQANIGIIYATTPDDKAGRLMIVDPAWRKALPDQWTLVFPQRLAQKFGDEPFQRRVILSAQYLSTVFPNKLAFVLKPRGGKLSEGSVKFSRASYIGIEILGYFIILFTAFRTFWPARLRDEDQDDFSNELRRLKKERQIW
jgi:hypothetical protein